MTFQSICAVKGVKAYGMKEGKFGLTLIRASGTAAGVFTENLVKAAPIELMRKQIKKGTLEAVIANSGCANAYTGKRGYSDAVAMTGFAGSALGVEPDLVGVASTGVIGRYLDLPLIQRQCEEIAPKDRMYPGSRKTCSPGYFDNRYVSQTCTRTKRNIHHWGNYQGKRDDRTEYGDNARIYLYRCGYRCKIPDASPHTGYQTHIQSRRR